MRQHTIWFTAAHQELYQIDEQLRNTLLNLGTYILGSTSSMDAARQLADALFFRDPWWVKHWRPVYGRVLSHSPLEVIAEEPEFMPLEEQTELFAQRITRLGRFQFLLRPAIAEGHIGSAVLPLTIRDLDRNKETGEYQFPEITLSDGCVPHSRSTPAFQLNGFYRSRRIVCHRRSLRRHDASLHHNRVSGRYTPTGTRNSNTPEQIPPHRMAEEIRRINHGTSAATG
jgi:hypothetical protein